MTTILPLSTVVLTIARAVIILLSIASPSRALGSGSTLAVISGTGTVCGLTAYGPTQGITCYSRLTGQTIPVHPNVSFSAISGGHDFFCGLRSGGFAFICWNTFGSGAFNPQRVYINYTAVLETLSVGDRQVCAIVNDTLALNSTDIVNCWRGGYVPGNQSVTGRFGSISSGSGFSCGILMSTKRVRCWGSNGSKARGIEAAFGDMEMLTIEAGDSHVCGVNSTGFLVCKGDNRYGQLNVPNNYALEYKEMALGSDYSCAIRQNNGSVVCWGGRGEYSDRETEGVYFESIVAGSNFTCGLISRNFSVMCWGPGWPNHNSVSGPGAQLLPLGVVLPGPCVQSSCSDCGIYGQSEDLCSGSGNICRPCDLNVYRLPQPPGPSAQPPSVSPRRSKTLTTGLLVFAIVGSVGTFSGICTVIYCLYTGVCFGKKKVHNSVQPTITRNGSNDVGRSSNHSGIISRSSTIRRQGSRLMRRQRSGTSSKHPDRAEEFSLADLAAATNDFSLENKIGAGSFGVVYRGKLADGREVAIKRGETGQKTKKFQEKESAFDSELAFLSRLHHKHLVRLVGYCEDGDERLLVYEYMKNGALYDHLHNKNNTEKNSSLVNRWKMRIKIALDAARGIEYLHNYAVPSIIHRDIKSSNILLDANWTARVSDFGLSLMGPESERDYSKPMKAAGTVGYIDPEYYGLNVLTAKSDVYGLGVVLLELLTGKRAIFKDSDNEDTPTSLVDFAVPKIMAGEWEQLLDPRVGKPELSELDAVELVANTAKHCVNLEGKDRPSMSDIVVNLERALSLCDDSHGSISSSIISIVSD